MTRRAIVVAAVVVALGIGLAGCAPAGPVYTSEAAQALQSSVLAVTEAAAEDDPDSALARLDELQAALDAQLAGGGIDQARYDSVSAAVSAVRADLQSAIDARQAEEAAVTPEESGPGNSNNSNKPGKPDKPGKPGKDD